MTGDICEQPKRDSPRAKAQAFARELTAEVGSMHNLLRAALLLENDRNLRSALAPAGGGVAVVLQSGSGWMLAGPQGIAFYREPPHDSVLLPLDDFSAGLQNGTWAVRGSIWQRYDTRASAMLRATLGLDKQATQAKCETLLRWAPLVEHVAYLMATKIVGFLDEIRCDLKAELTNVGASPAWALFVMGFKQAIKLLSDGKRPAAPPQPEVRWSSRALVIADPFAQNPQGEFVGLASIPEALAVAPSKFLPDIPPKLARSDFSPSLAEAVQLFRRAWVPDDGGKPSPSIH